LKETTALRLRRRGGRSLRMLGLETGSICAALDMRRVKMNFTSGTWKNRELVAAGQAALSEKSILLFEWD